MEYSWESRLPMEGDVRIACVNLLVSNGIKSVANFNIGNDPEEPVSAHTACCCVIQYISDRLEESVFIPIRIPSAVGKYPDSQVIE